MTKRDVAVWFCKVVALMGIIDSSFALLAAIFNLISLRAAPGISFGFGYGGMLSGIPNLGLYIFVWLLAGNIGTELAAEGEYGPSLTSKTELTSLLVRCAGLALFLSATIPLSVVLLQLAYFQFSNANFGSPASTSFYLRSLTSQAVSHALQSILGFLLAFTPRIRLFFGK